jgi:hypothetical protein
MQPHLNRGTEWNTIRLPNHAATGSLANGISPIENGERTESIQRSGNPGEGLLRLPDRLYHRMDQPLFRKLHAVHPCTQ